MPPKQNMKDFVTGPVKDDDVEDGEERDGVHPLEKQSSSMPLKYERPEPKGGLVPR